MTETATETARPEYRKPLPKPTETDQPHWDGLKRHQVLVQKCDDCGSFLWYPRQMCSNCMSFALTWTEVDPTGTIYSLTTQHHGTGSKFDAELPYSVAVVELDAHPDVKLVGPVNNVTPEEIHIGQRVRGTFLDATDDVTFLHFEPFDTEGDK